VGDPAPAGAPKPTDAPAPRQPAFTGRRGHGKPMAAAQSPSVLPTEQPKRDVVEILRGDRYEQRNFTKGDGR
jgi:hypothetical protein